MDEKGDALLSREEQIKVVEAVKRGGHENRGYVTHDEIETVIKWARQAAVDYAILGTILRGCVDIVICEDGEPSFILNGNIDKVEKDINNELVARMRRN